MSEDPVADERAALIAALLAAQRRKDSSRERRWDVILRDPKAHFTKEEDWKTAQQYAEKYGWDLSLIPKLNENG